MPIFLFYEFASTEVTRLIKYNKESEYILGGVLWDPSQGSGMVRGRRNSTHTGPMHLRLEEEILEVKLYFPSSSPSFGIKVHFSLWGIWSLQQIVWEQCSHVRNLGAGAGGAKKQMRPSGSCWLPNKPSDWRSDWARTRCCIAAVSCGFLWPRAYSLSADRKSHRGEWRKQKKSWAESGIDFLLSGNRLHGHLLGLSSLLRLWGGWIESPRIQAGRLWKGGRSLRLFGNTPCSAAARGQHLEFRQVECPASGLLKRTLANAYFCLDSS